MSVKNPGSITSGRSLITLAVHVLYVLAEVSNHIDCTVDTTGILK